MADRRLELAQREPVRAQESLQLRNLDVGVDGDRHRLVMQLEYVHKPSPL
jgi:hypothetical protein